MTDLRKLAERIAQQEGIQFWPSDPRPEYEHESLADMVERILREHNEELRAEIIANIGDEDCYYEDLDNIIRRIFERMLEGGEVGTERKKGDAKATPATPAAPDQLDESYDWSPHAFVDLFGTDTDCRHVVRKGFDYVTFCGKDRSDPIHQTNEVNDEPQVTNYDAEAEAQARIAELERERDEARAERDELLYAMPKSVMRRIKAQGWVRLDDETIDRVASAVYLKTNDHRFDDVSTDHLVSGVLRDLRDGKLKEVSDDDA